MEPDWPPFDIEPFDPFDIEPLDIEPFELEPLDIDPFEVEPFTEPCVVLVLPMVEVEPEALDPSTFALAFADEPTLAEESPVGPGPVAVPLVDP